MAAVALQKAQSLFQQAFDDLRAEQREEFLQWIFETKGQTAFECLAEKMRAAELKMTDIVNDLKEALPLSGIADGEKILFPSTGVHKDCVPEHTVSVDAFLYDDWVLDQLCDEGKLQRSFCKDCGSHNTAPLTFISHSMSKRRLQYLFLNLLPDLAGKTLLDIGSRLGTVLYGAHIYNSASRIIGVEINPELCQLQKKIVVKHGLSDRIQVVCDDITRRADLLQEADVVVAHSVVDFFLPEEEHSRFWKFIHDNTRGRRGTLLVTTPSLEKSIAHLDTGIDLAAWVKPLTSASCDAEDYEAVRDPDLAELMLYQCL